MGFKIREIETECTFSSALTIDALRHAIPPEAITRILAQEAAGEVRERKLTMSVVVWLVIALHLDATRSISAVLGTLACGLRFIWSDPALRLPQASVLGPWVSRLRHARWRTPAWGARLEPPAQPHQAAAQPYLAGWRGSGVWAAIGA
jgi:Insertion element 4 transposase N-terminal